MSIIRRVSERQPFVSVIPGIDWPALPDPKGAAILALLYQLERTQWQPPPALRAQQYAQVRRLLAHAHATVPFYRDRLPALPDDSETPLAEAWRAVPLLTRADIQAAGSALHSAAPPPEHGGITEIFTSGSVGTPIRSLRTQLWELLWSAFTVRNHLWHRRDVRGTLAAIRESAPTKALYPDGARAARWGYSTRQVLASGPCVSLNVTTPVERQLEWLVRQDPDYLVSHPTIIERLAALSADRGVRLPRLRQVEAISEALAPRVRALVREAWGVPTVDVYSAREAGYLALQCPDHEHLHVQAESVLLEVLDDAGRPCSPGAVGRVVVTPLHNFAMPLIRYAIGDYAEAGAACACGRGLPVLARVLGRQQNMLVLPSGEARWPLLSSDDIKRLLAIAPVRRHQMVQKSLEAVELRVVTARPLRADEQAALVQWAQAKLGHAFAVAVVGVDDLPLTAAGKFADFVSEVPARPP